MELYLDIVQGNIENLSFQELTMFMLMKPDPQFDIWFASKDEHIPIKGEKSSFEKHCGVINYGNDPDHEVIFKLTKQ